MSAKILVVDDEKLIRWTLSEALRSWAFQPVEASSVKEALETFDSESPALTLLDINLPDGSGLDVLGQIREKQSDGVPTTRSARFSRTSEKKSRRSISPCVVFW